jgi:hypothetical protein
VTPPEPSPADHLALDLSPGVHRLDAHAATVAALESANQAGWATAVVDIGNTRDKAALLDAFADALHFPTWVGRNWDALDDALRDLSWWPAGERGRLVVVRGLAADLEPSRRNKAVLRDVLELAAANWAGTDTPLVVLIEG